MDLNKQSYIEFKAYNKYKEQTELGFNIYVEYLIAVLGISIKVQ